MRTNTSRSLQRQPEVVEPHYDQKQTQPKEGKQHNGRGLRKNTDGPEIGDLSQESRGTAAPRGQANQYLRKNQVNPLHSEATEGGQPRINLNHRKPAANTGSEREEPKVRNKKTSGT